MRLPQRTIPVIRKASTAQIGAQIVPANIFDDILHVADDILHSASDFISGPAKDFACSSCGFLPHPWAAAGCTALCSL